MIYLYVCSRCISDESIALRGSGSLWDAEDRARLPLVSS
jgi:hypothetical protein